MNRFLLQLKFVKIPKKTEAKKYLVEFEDDRYIFPKTKKQISPKWNQDKYT